MPKKGFTTESFIEASKAKFGDRYDYSEAVYTGMQSKLTLRCTRHDKVFETTPQSHLKSKTGGCPICSQEARSQSNTVDAEDFFRRCREIHHNKYDYSEAVYTGTRNKITVICPIHGRFEQTANEHVRGAGCPQCRIIEASERNRSTVEEFIEKARAVFGNRYDYSQFEYVNDRTPGIIICPDHGPFLKTPSHHLRGQGCPRCSKRNHQRTQEETVAECRAVHGDTYDLSKVTYNGSSGKITVGCRLHGDFRISWGHFLNGQGCPKCRYIKSAQSKTKTTEKYIEEARAIWGNRYDYSKVNYTKGYEKIEIICREHGPFWIAANNHISSVHPQGCPVCGRISCDSQRSMSSEEYFSRCRVVHNNRYDYSHAVFDGVGSKIDIICPIHGLFTQNAGNHLYLGHGCPKCGMSTPYYERELTEFIQSKGYEVIQHDRQALDGLELDIYVPSLRFAIECNGIFWHSEVRKESDYHLKKTLLCEEKGIRLFHLFDDEWKDKKEIVMSMISNIIGERKGKYIRAHKCEIKDVPSDEARQFLDDNHLQGAVGSQIRYGLYYNGELVSLMTFGKTRHFIGGQKAQYELLRFCNKLNTRVMGGASKLFKHFVNTVHPDSIISYADRRWSVGNLYDRLGFKLYNKSKPNYFYIVNGRRMNRFNFRKSELVRKYGCPENVNEHQFCMSQGWYRIYDCGCLCYRWDASDNNITTDKPQQSL